MSSRYRSTPVLETDQPRYATSLTKHRLGQGGFRISVTDAYQRRCAISGEKTLPVLEAAHIQPYSCEGPHMLQNGLLLRSDIHTLFDGGYITITPDYRIEVSQRLHNDYGNGRDYYKFHGERLLVLPESIYHSGILPPFRQPEERAEINLSCSGFHGIMERKEADRGCFGPSSVMLMGNSSE